MIIVVRARSVSVSPEPLVNFLLDHYPLDTTYYTSTTFRAREIPIPQLHIYMTCSFPVVNNFYNHTHVYVLFVSWISLYYITLP